MGVGNCNSQRKFFLLFESEKNWASLYWNKVCEEAGPSSDFTWQKSAAASVAPRLSYEETAHYSVDNKFVKAVISGINALIGEDWVRQQFYDHNSCILQVLSL